MTRITIAGSRKFNNYIKLECYVNKLCDSIIMKICNATGNGVCVGCNHIPPKDNGDLCRMKAQEIINALAGGDIVAYSYETGKFYRKVIFTNSVYEIDDEEWEVL